MSSVGNNLSEILANAEAAVLKVLSDAAAAGNYTAIDRARTLAEKLRNMNRDLDRQQGAKKTSATQSQPTKKKPRRAKTGRKKDYPKFEFRDGSLYKFGWSKKKNDEYIHRVPVAIVNLVSNTLQRFSGTAEPISSEQIIESDSVRGSVPRYQVYTVLAFLKDRGIITSAGRDGFQLPLEIKSQVDEIIRQEAA